MGFSDYTQFYIPKPIKYANSDSSLLNSDESACDDESPQKPMTPLTEIEIEPTLGEDISRIHYNPGFFF